jgi:Fe-S-cluster containining protein
MASGLHLARLRCTACGECCRVVHVPLTFADLSRLCQARGLDPNTVIDWASLEEVDFSGEPSNLVLLPQGYRVMFLRRVEGACRFLDAASRCAVHEARPAACRAYPLHASFSKRGGLVRLRVLRGVDCPYELEAESALSRVRHDHAQLARELHQHYAAVATWNRSQGHRRRLGKPLASATQLFARVLGAPPLGTNRVRAAHSEP